MKNPTEKSAQSALMPKLVTSLVLLSISLTTFVSQEVYATACQSNQAIDWYNASYDTDNLDKKHELLTKATDLCSHNYEMVMLLGDVQYGQDNIAEAAATYEHLLNPTVSETKAQQAEVLLRLMFAYSDLGKRLKVSNYANLIKELKNNGMTWDNTSEKSYQGIYSKNRQSLLDTPLTAMELTASIIEKQGDSKNLEVIAGDAERSFPAVTNINLDMSINFDYNSAKLTADSKQQLTQVIKALMPNLDKIEELSIYGHTDARGSDEYNLELSQKRANSVKKYLIHNVPNLSSKVTAIGKGEQEPISTEITEAAYTLNRRVSFSFKPLKP